MSSNVVFELPPHLFNRVNACADHWGGPPIDSLLLIKFFCHLTCAFRIVVLHKSITRSLTFIFNQWKEDSSQNLNVKCSIYCLIRFAVPAQTWTLSVCLVCGFDCLSFPVFTRIVRCAFSTELKICQSR